MQSKALRKLNDWMTLEKMYILAKQQNCPKCLTDEVRVMAHEIATIYLP